MAIFMLFFSLDQGFFISEYLPTLFICISFQKVTRLTQAMLTCLWAPLGPEHLCLLERCVSVYLRLAHWAIML